MTAANKIACPQCGAKEWETVNLCMGCIRKNSGPVTMAIHSCYEGGDSVRLERDRYKLALKKMFIEGAGKPCVCGCCYVCIARDALRITQEGRKGD